MILCTYIAVRTYSCVKGYIMLNVSWKTSMESPFSARGFQVTKSCNKSEALLKSNGCQTVRHICSINVNNIMMIKTHLVFKQKLNLHDNWRSWQACYLCRLPGGRQDKTRHTLTKIKSCALSKVTFECLCLC